MGSRLSYDILLFGARCPAAVGSCSSLAPRYAEKVENTVGFGVSYSLHTIYALSTLICAALCGVSESVWRLELWRDTRCR